MRVNGGMQPLFEALDSEAELSSAACTAAVAWLADPEADALEKERFLEGFKRRGETAGELASFAQALTELAVDPQIVPGNVAGPMLDVCGTGGDKLELFNISTASMFVLAGGGAAVVKHGNRAITSQCGGADVLEALGVKIDLVPAQLRECVYRHGLGFVFAPAYHPAFGVIGPVRRALAGRGIPTIFNLLGPLLNPARPAHQLVGVYAGQLLPKYAEALRLLGRTRAWAVHGSGADELTLAGEAEVLEVDAMGVRGLRVDPFELGFTSAPVEALRGGDRVLNARLLEGILTGAVGGAPLEVVLLNSAAGFVVAGLAGDMREGVHRARESVASGAALSKLDALRAFAAA
jgi:anthranilate phosphoribosyltransferase